MICQKKLFVRSRRKLVSFWPSQEADQFAQVTELRHRPLAPRDLSFPVPDFLRSVLDEWHEIEDVSYVKCFHGNLSIDPLSGHVFLGRTMLAGSTDVERTRSKEPTPFYIGHLARAGRSLPAAVLMHHKFYNNYFHFWNNIAAKSGMLDQLDIPTDIPIIIPEQMANIPFVREALAMKIFGKRPVFLQKPMEILKVETAYVIKPFDIDALAIDRTLDKLGLDRKPKGQRRVFIARGPASPNQRFFRNQSDLDRLLSEFDIEKVDPQQYTLKKQIEIFSGASLIISAHGAGMTNLLFRRHSPGSVIELFNPDLLSLHYALIANAFGQHYQALENLEPEGRCSVATSKVDIDRLRTILTTIF